MSLSDPDIVKLLRAFFVCAWTDLEGDPCAAGSPRIKKDGGVIPLPRGAGAANLQVLVYTPDARLIHATTGAIHATEMRFELIQALITQQQLAGVSPRTAPAFVARRQGEIQKAYEGRAKPAAMTSAFGMTRVSAEKARRAFARHTSRHVRSDRQIVQRHPLVRARDVETRWLTEGRSSDGFAGDGTILDVPDRTAMAKLTKAFAPPTMPVPWDDLAGALRGRVAAALGVEAPTDTDATPRLEANPRGAGAPRRKEHAGGESTRAKRG